MPISAVVVCVQERLRTLMWGALSGHCRLPPLPAPTHHRAGSTIPIPAKGIAANCVVRPQQRRHGSGSSSKSEQEEEQQEAEAVDEEQAGTSAAAEHWAQQARKQQAEQAQQQQQRQAEQQGVQYREYGPLLPFTVLGDVLSDLPEVNNFCMRDLQTYG